MEQTVLGFAGKKQSGKSSAANFIGGYILTQTKRRYPELPLPRNFTINEKGKLIVDATFTNSEGVEETKPAELNLRRRDAEFYEFAQHYIYPYVKIYSFADTLKEMAVRIFGLTENQVYGDEMDKKSPTKIEWNDMHKLFHPAKLPYLKKDGKIDRKMLAREFLQYFGTDICRTLYDECWIHDCINRIAVEGYPFAIIDDCRFANEVKAIRSFGGKVILLKRKIAQKDEHRSENDLRMTLKREYDYTLNNDDMDIVEKNQRLLDLLYEWGWLSGHVA